MNQALLRTAAITKRYGALLVTDQVSLDIRPGELHAIIGPNGAGKTTLINQLSGELASDSGQIQFDGRDVTALGIHARARLGLVRSYQITSVFDEGSLCVPGSYVRRTESRECKAAWPRRRMLCRHSKKAR